MDNTITQLPLDPPQQIQPAFDLSDVKENTPPSAAVATQRAFKFHQGLAPVLNKEYPEIYSSIASGDEDTLRNQASATMDMSAEQNRQARIVQGVKTGQVDVKDLAPLTPTDPDTVMEKAYPQAVVNTLDQAAARTNSPVYKDIQQYSPNDYASAKSAGADVGAYREYALSLSQDVEKDMQGRSTLDKLEDFGKGLLPFFSDYQLRNQVAGGSELEGGPLGNNLRVQTRRLLGLPFDQYKAQITNIVNGLRENNPQMASQFLHAVLGQTNSDIFASNIGNVIDASMIPGAGKLVSKTAELMTAGRNAVKDVIEASKAPEATKATLSNAAGDAGTAAVHQATDQLASSLNGTADPLKQAWDALPSNMNLIRNDLHVNAGRWGQENVNRMDEYMFQGTNNILDRIESVSKVDRIPELKASPDVINAMREEHMRDYRGPANTLMDTKPPVWDRMGNRWMWEDQIGDESGNFFKSPQLLRNFAQKYGFRVAEDTESLKALDNEMAELQANLKEPPAMDADVHELNRYDAMEKRLQDLATQKQDILNNGTGGYTIKNQGFGYYLSKMTPVNEYSDVMWNNIAKLGETPKSGIVRHQGENYTTGDKYYLPQGWMQNIRTFIGRGRTPEEVLSPAENAQRKIATHASSVLEQAFKEASEPLTDLPKKYWENFNRTLEANRDMKDSLGRSGKFFHNPGELDDFYYRNFGVFPSDEEYKAYFTYVRNYELERMLRDVAVGRNMSKLGVERRRLTITGEGNNTTKSPYFYAAEQKEFPGGDPRDGVLVHKSDGTQRVLSTGSLLPNKLNNELREAVAKGELKVLRIYNPELRELKGFGTLQDQPIRYIITDGYDSAPIQFGNLVPRREGGHFAYKANGLIKQANIKSYKLGKDLIHRYEGDTTAFEAPPIRSEAKELVDHLNNVRKLIKDGRMDEAEAYNNEHFMYDWETHYGRYKSGEFNVNEPFQLLPQNKTIAQMDRDLFNRYPNLKDGSTSGSDARQFQVEYTGERDADRLMGFSKAGTPDKPVFQYRPAAMLDPIVAYNRGLNRMINSFFMDDMKDYSVRHWIEQAAPFFKQNISLEELRSAPFKYFENPEWRSGVQQTNPAEYWNLNSARMMIRNFVGTPSKLESWLQKSTQDVVDSIYRARGGKASPLLSNVAALRTRNPIDFIRWATTHAKLGLFNIPAFFTQLMTHSNIFGIAGLRPAAGGSLGTLLHTWARVNGSKEILDELDKKASSFGKLLGDSYAWKPGEWKEAYQMMNEKFGFKNVGGEHAFFDAPFSAKMVTHGSRSFLDWGMSFFHEGATATRMSAFYTSYLEFRAEKPIGAITRTDEEKILARAALLDHNMSRASNSILHTGIMAPAGQFMAYSLRLSELMWGKRLTTAEKARLFVTSSMLYGIPLGGAGLLGFPIGDYLRQKAQEHGLLVHDNFYKNVAMEGLPAELTAFLTAKDWKAEHGNWYNYSKWGPESYQVITNANTKDGTIWKILGGAAGGTMYNSLMDMNPVWRWGTSFMYPDDQYYPLTKDDMMAPAKEISSVSQWSRAWQALNTGRWMSRKGNYIDDTTGVADTLFMTATGLVHTETSDIGNTIANIDEQTQLYKEVASDFRTLIQREMQATADGNKDQADAYHKQAMAILARSGYPQEKIPSLLSSAMMNNEPLAHRLEREFNTRNVPQQDKMERMKTQGRIDELQQEKRNLK